MTQLALFGYLIFSLNCSQWERDYDGNWRAYGAADIEVAAPVMTEDNWPMLEVSPSHYEGGVEVTGSNLKTALEDKCYCAKSGGLGSCR